jgi:biotin carboxyl carrier protein
VADVLITALGNGAFHVVDGTHSRVAYAAASGDACWVFLDGHVYVIETDCGSPGGPSHTPVAQLSRARRQGHADQTALSAPMPATVLAITVEAGERVSTGDVLVLLEAMKMELPVKAPRDAVVKRIACRVGDLVQPGVPLLELE